MPKGSSPRSHSNTSNRSNISSHSSSTNHRHNDSLRGPTANITATAQAPQAIEATKAVSHITHSLGVS